MRHQFISSDRPGYCMKGENLTIEEAYERCMSGKGVLLLLSSDDTVCLEQMMPKKAKCGFCHTNCCVVQATNVTPEEATCLAFPQKSGEIKCGHYALPGVILPIAKVDERTGAKNEAAEKRVNLAFKVIREFIATLR